MVLADDNFATLRAAVEEGRRVYDNLVKALSFVLPTSLGQALIIAIAALAFPLRGGEPQLPVEPVQILWINLIVAVALALPLALEARAGPNEAPSPGPADSSPRPTPAREDAGRLGDADGRGARSVRVRAWAAARRRRRRCARAGASADDNRYRRGAAPGALPDHLPVAHSPKQGLGHFSNPAVFAGIALVLLLQALFVTLPVAHDVFGSAELDLTALAAAMAAALVVLPVTSLEERWRVRRAHEQGARYERVVLTAYDGSANAERAVDQAAALFTGADAVVLTVWQSVGDATAAARVALPDDVVRDGLAKLDAAAGGRGLGHCT